MVALARCLACIPARPPAQPNRQQYVTHLIQDLPPTLQQLASSHSTTSTQELSSVNLVAERLLQHLRTLMMFMHSWRDAQSSIQPDLISNAAVEALISCWPLCEQVLAAQAGSPMFRERLAACCTTALRTHMQDCRASLGSMLHTASHAVAVAGNDAHAWCQALCAALDQSAAQPGQQEQSTQLIAALRVVDTSVACDVIKHRSAADQNPELATVSTLVHLHCCLRVHCPHLQLQHQVQETYIMLHQISA